MKGLYTAIKRFAVHDGAGLRTTVFLQGCPLRCRWCQNPEGLSVCPTLTVRASLCVGCGQCAVVCPQNAVYLKEGKVQTDRDRCNGCGVCEAACPTNARLLTGRAIEAAALAKKLLSDREFFTNGGGVTFSGGECLLQWEFVCETAALLCEKGVGVDIDTCGFAPRAALEALIPYTDTFLYDLKAINPAVHKACTGQDNVLILDNLAFLAEQGCRIEIRYPLVMGYNDGEAQEMAAFLSAHGIGRIKVLPYHDFSRLKYENISYTDPLPPKSCIPTEADMARILAVFTARGIFAVHGRYDD